MQEPKYKPEHWVIYQQGESGGFGRISGGTFNGQGWYYTVQGAIATGQPHSVAETEIAYLYNEDDKSWIAPAQAGGQSSVYTNI